MAAIPLAYIARYVATCVFLFSLTGWAHAPAPVVPYLPHYPQPMIMVAKAISREKVEKEAPAPQPERWQFEVTRMLQGTDVSGDTISVGAGPVSYKAGTSYVLYWRPDGSAKFADVTIAMEATEANIDGVAKEVKASGGAVKPKLVAYARILTVLLGDSATFYVTSDGSFDVQVVRNGPLLHIGGKIPKDAVDRVVKLFATAKKASHTPDQEVWAGVIWRDREGHVHRMNNVESNDITLEVVRLLSFYGKPLPIPTAQPGK